MTSSTRQTLAQWGSARRPTLLELGWGLALTAVAILVGVGLGREPVLVAAVVALAVAIAGIAAVPATALLAILVVRASLDTSGELVSVGGTNLAGALTAAVAAGGAAALVFRGTRLPARRLRRALLVLACWALASLAFTPALLEGVSSVLRIVAMLVLFGLGAWTVRDVERLRRIAWVVVLSSIVPVGVGLYQLVSGSTYSRQGFSAISGTFLYANGFALYLLMVLALGIVLLFESRDVARRVVLLVILGLTGVAFVVTYARAEWIGLIVILGVLALMHYRRLIPLAVAVLSIGALAVPSSFGLVEERFADLDSASARYDDNSWAWRVRNWEGMLHFATDQPLTGHGLSSFPPLTYEQFGTTTDGFDIDGRDSGVFAHNDYLMMAVELGLPGLALWLVVLVGIARAMLRARATPSLRPYATGMFAVAVAYLLISAADNVMTTTSAMFYFFAMAGAVVGADSQVRREASPALAG